MIQIGDTILDLSDPVTLAALITGLAILLVVILLIVAVRRAGKSAEAVQLVAAQLGRMSYDMQSLGQGQQQLAGNIQTVSDAQANAKLMTELYAINEELQVPTPEQFGISREHFFGNLEIMAEQAIGSGSPGNNPRVPSAEEIVQIYKKLW